MPPDVLVVGGANPAADSAADFDRPWTAEIESPGEGYKPKYNMTLLPVANPAPTVHRSPASKARKELWVASADKGVDALPNLSERSPAAQPTQQTQSTGLIQVRLPTSHSPSCPIDSCLTCALHMQGFFKTNHPANRDREM